MRGLGYSYELTHKSHSLTSKKYILVISSIFVQQQQTNQLDNRGVGFYIDRN